MPPDNMKPATRGRDGLHSIVQLGGERSEGSRQSEQCELAVECLKRAAFLFACAGLERGAVAIRIAHYADRGAAS